MAFLSDPRRLARFSARMVFQGAFSTKARPATNKRASDGSPRPVIVAKPGDWGSNGRPDTGWLDPPH